MYLEVSGCCLSPSFGKSAAAADILMALMDVPEISMAGVGGNGASRLCSMGGGGGFLVGGPKVRFSAPD